MEAKRELILELHKKGKRNIEIFNLLKAMNINKRLIERTLARYRKTNSVTPARKPGKKRSIRTKANIKKVRERIRRNPAQSMRKIARDLKLPKSSVHEIATKDLQLKAFKKQKVHGLTSVQKQARIQKCKHLIRWHGDREILFSDEKLFLLQNSHNQQNDRVWSVKLADAPKDKLAVERFQNVSSVMVWGAVSKRGKLPLHFVEKGVKINQDYYIEQVLKNHLLPHAHTLFGNNYFCFQQDSAPAHKGKRTQQWLKENLPDFISPSYWPASSPDLNPLDYSIWGYMLSKLGNIRHMNFGQFKCHLVKIWNEIPNELVSAACESFPTRLRKVVKEKGERFELD